MTSEFCHTIDCEYSDINDVQGALLSMRKQELQAIRIHNIFTHDELGFILDDLIHYRTPFPQSHFPDAFRSHFYGENLNMAHPDMIDYFRNADIFQEQIKNYIRPEINVQQRIRDILTQLAGGIESRPAYSPTFHKNYMFMTFRHHESGGYIPAHCDNEFYLRPTYNELTQLCHPDIYSYVLCLQAPKAGGRTMLYNYTQPNVSDRMISADDQKKPDISETEYVGLEIPAGSMLIFDSGRYLHALEKIAGSTPRWTACSFMAFTQDNSRLYCWG